MDATFIVSWLKPSNFSTYFHAWHVFRHISLCTASCKMATWMPNGKFCGESWSSSTSHLWCITSRSFAESLSSKPDLLEIPFDTRNIHDNRISTIWSRTVRPICSADALTFLNPSSNFWNGSQSLFKWPRPASQMRILLGKEIGNRPCFGHLCCFQGWKHPKHEDPFSDQRSAWGVVTCQSTQKPAICSNISISGPARENLTPANSWNISSSTRCGWFLSTEFSRVMYRCK